MKLRFRAAGFAVLTFCFAALANAATLDGTPAAPANGQAAQVQSVNVQEHHVVPALPQAAQLVRKDGEIVQPLPQAALQEDQDYETLLAAVEAQDVPAESDSELRCLATGIYFEAKGEPLAGQLAVAEVLLNRTRSGRFPTTVCGVLAQPGQFSFVRGGRLPSPPANAQWRRALAVAQVAQKDLWESPANEALYFHARYARGGGFNRDRVATVGNHIFYR